MGLFSKNKEEAPAPPMPSAPPINNNDTFAPPSAEINSLVPPPIPGGTLADIKTQVSKGTEFGTPSSMSLESSSSAGQLSVQVPKDTSMDVKQEEDVNDFDESLFDFSEIDLPTDEKVNNVNTVNDAENVKLVNVNSSDEQNTSENNSENQNAANTNVSKEDLDDDLSFIKKRRHKPNMDDVYFVTTKQFRALLEVVDSVKRKVKEASETHLRLMDIKSEEDIEYENLRKDFEYLEDKLYEVDSILFEK